MPKTVAGLLQQQFVGAAGALCFEPGTQALMTCSKNPLTTAGHWLSEGQNVQHTFGGKSQIQHFHLYSQLHSWLKAMQPDISSPSLLDDERPPVWLQTAWAKVQSKKTFGRENCLFW